MVANLFAKYLSWEAFGSPNHFLRTGNDEVDLGGYTDGTGRRKREIEENSNFFQANFSDFSFSNLVLREKRAATFIDDCVAKFDSAIDVVYDNDGNCKCFCGKGMTINVDAVNVSLHTVIIKWRKF